MRLPPAEFPAASWGAQMLERWIVLTKKAATMEASVGNNDVYERTCAELHRMAQTLRFDALPEMLKRRITARTLTSLWLKNEVMELLNARLLTTMLRAQQPRLTPMTLRQLAQLYFRRFDRLDEKEGVRELLERSLLQQLDLIPPSKIQTSRADPLVTLKREGHWLLGLDGPRHLAERVRQGGRELGETFMELGLHGFDDGRYGDICRAHFYLETLRHLPPGESDPVLDELLKPAVAKAPFEGARRIGHVALEILIDRAGQEAGEVWQNFILNLAGDPRISSSAVNFREWWQPLGEERIQKVRGWLSKEDLRLFLQAVEQYGLETANTEMQRMFPARKRFLEGLFKLKLIRNTRLLLGGKAQQSVKRILGKDVKTSFARMDGQMTDKAVIYLDCGDFHLVEGSHSFKIWVYLAAPGDALRTYERNTFSHYDLTTTVPGTYKKLYPGLPYDAFVHTPYTWQNKVFTFLAENGIAIDVEQLLSPEDYRLQLRKFGIPAVSAKRTVVPAPAKEGAKAVARAPTAAQQGTEHAAALPSRNADVPTPPGRSADVSVAANGAVSSSAVASGRDNPVLQRTKLPPFSSLQLAALRYLEAHPRCGFYALLEAVSNQGGNVLNVKTMLESSLSQYVQQDEERKWLLSTHGEQLLAELARSEPSDASQSVPSAADMNANDNAGSRVARLEPFALAVLRYFAANPGDKVRYAANVLEVDARLVNQALYGPLNGICTQDDKYGWQLTGAAQRELEAFEAEGREQ
ncbi:EH signature domain-containing protein [Pseudomonas sp. GD03909]|nr:EH signature domain-containing protein [Pseudomonas sp. GD03909]